LGKCNESETAVAHLLSHGFSVDEIARAMNANTLQARTLVENVTRKLQSVSANDLMFPAIQLNRMTW
jgi:DNA-binding CsgD family transcriptional regulator